MRPALLDAAARFFSEALSAFSVVLPQPATACMADFSADEIDFITEAARAAGESFFLNAIVSTPQVVE
jgi:hypothetical protein